MEKIEEMRSAFYNAYTGTSFSPEVRASQCVRDFSEQLSSDLAELGDKAGNYAEKYIAYLKTWTARKSRCMSVMITGPARFPTERNRKALNAEQAAWEEFQAWRERYIKRANRVPVKTPEEEIDDALIKLEKARAEHNLMIEINKVLRKKTDESEKRRILSEEYGLKPETIENIFTPSCFNQIGFASFELTNSNARIKSLEEKLLIMKARIERRDSFEPIQFSGGVIDIQDDRVVIRHDEKPTAAVIEALKRRGFHWSPKCHYWCRKHTAIALKDAKEICSVGK